MAIRSVEDYIQSQSPPIVRIMIALRELLHKTAPEARGSMKWAQPVYESGGPMIFLKAFKKNVQFGFWRGASLEDPGSLLVGNGKTMRHVLITDVSEVQAEEEALTNFIHQAIRLNQELGDPTHGLE